MSSEVIQRIAERFHQLPQDKRQLVYQKVQADGLNMRQFPVLPFHHSAEAAELSYAQQRQWFLWHLDPDSAAYHITGGLQLEGEVNLSALTRAFQLLIARHSSLRTQFVQVDAEVKQQVLPIEIANDFQVEVGAGDNIDAVRQQWLNTPFNLTQGNLIRVGLLTLAPNQYQLVVVVHHIIADGGSLQILVGEFAALYSQLLSAEIAPGDLSSQLAQSALPALNIAYGDYAKWQKDWMTAGELERQLAYWQQKLGDEQPVLQLKVDNGLAQNSEHGSTRGASHAWQLPQSLTQQLGTFATSHQVSHYMVLLTAFQVLLQRYTGMEQIRIGTPIANRQRAEVANLVGLFVNTQVQDNRFDSRTSLQQVLAQVKASTLGAQEYQDLPFEQLVEALQPERSSEVHPLFQILFNYQFGDLSQLQQLPELKVGELPATTGEVQFELVLDAHENRAGACLLTFTYDQKAISTQRIVRMSQHFERVLAALLTEPTMALGDINLLDDSETQQWQRWGLNPQLEDTTPVQQKFSRLADTQPDAVAAVFADLTLSYKQLDERSNQLAQHLQSLNIGREDRVGVALQRSMDTVVTLLGVLKTGAAFVPMDQDYPPERLAYIAENSQLTAIITHPDAQSKLTEVLKDTQITHHLASLPVVNLAQLPWQTLSAQPLDVAIHPEQLAYMIYTSGSTGRPKGAAISHRALSNCMAWMARQYSPQPEEAVLHKAAFGFDVSCWEIFFPLSEGMSVVVAKPGDQRDPLELKRLIQQQRVAITSFPPALLQAFIELPDVAECTSLRHIMCGGEAVPAELFRDTYKALPDVVMNNLYGPTETTIHVTHWPFINDKRSLAPIGQGISQTHTYILDASLNPVPEGVTGELYIGGIQLARGYFARPDLTAERFVADSVLANGQRMYRTGDLARWNLNGEIEYLGRSDDQVQIRGFRIELGEIAEQLRRLPQVREAKVLVKHLATGDKLVAYVTGSIQDEQQLAQALGENVPDYMVPNAFVVLDKMPLTANGKVDSKALPEPQWAKAQEYSAPIGEAETMAAHLWADLLGLERVGRDDNFFSLGGHSLLAIKLVERARQAGWQAQVKTLFSQPVLKHFAAALTPYRQDTAPETAWSGIATDTAVITSEMLPLVSLDNDQIAKVVEQVDGGVQNVQDIYPLAPLQSGILFHHTLQEKGDAYITPNLLRFESRAQLSAFVDALNLVIARHDILRTAIFWQGLPEPVQVVQRQAKVEIKWLDYACDAPLTADEAGLTAAARRLNEAVDPTHFRLNTLCAPLIAAIAIAEVQDETCWLQLPSHHLVMDHTSLEVLVEEVQMILAGNAALLPEPVPFRHFVALAQQNPEAEAEQNTFFSELLGDIETPTAPFGLLDIKGTGEDILTHETAVPEALAAQVRHLAVKQNTSAAAVFHLAWAMVLQKLTGLNDPVFGTVMFGRSQGGEGADRAVGMFINTLPIRFRLRQADLKSGLQQAQQLLTALISHESASLSKAQSCSSVAKGTPLFSTLLNYRYSPNAHKHGDSKKLYVTDDGWQVFGGEERTNYPIGVSIDDAGDGFNIVAQTLPSVEPAQLCGYLLNALTQLVAEPALKQLGDWQALTDNAWQTQRLWSENTTKENTQQAVYRLFEAQVQKQPDAIAVTFKNNHVHYAELNQQANQLAHYLQSQGVGIESRVAVGMWRSVETVISLLAIMKVGASYVPLDLDYPAERLQYIVASSGVQLLLTHAEGVDALPPFPEQITQCVWQQIDLAPYSQDNLIVDAHPEQLAYVIYTSGSTGRPKGVAISHRSLVSCMQWMQREYQLTREDAVLHKAPFGFDVSCWELFFPLSQGGRIVVSEPGDHKDPDKLIALIKAQQVTTASFVPTMLQAFIEQTNPNEENYLRNIMVGGEAAPPELRQRMFAALPNAKVHNLYGPTETTIHVTNWEFTQAPRTTIPIGRAISNTSCYVLDEYLTPVPQGVVGELYLGGVGLSRGYLNRPDLTAERFVADPISASGGRLYRTGDLVRWNKEGLIEYMGRLDHQVKIRGLRIELEEIEAQLASISGIQKAVVLAKPSPSGERLVGYVQSQQVQSSDELKSILAKVLPDYMVPNSILSLERLPLSPNGKIDRDALPEPVWQDSGEFVAPINDMEQSVAQVWSEVLGINNISRFANFFTLGGDSIACLKVVSLMRQRGFEMAVKHMFETADLSQLALQLTELQGATGSENTLCSEPIIALNQKSAAASALFCLHDGFGKVLDYTTLARHLDGKRTVYGLTYQPGSLTGQAADLSALVASHLSEIRKVQVRGPYRLCGWSLGGVLAHAIAAELEQQGEQVEQLLLLDPYSPPNASAQRSTLAEQIGPMMQLQTFFSLLLSEESGFALMQDVEIQSTLAECSAQQQTSSDDIQRLMLQVFEHPRTEFMTGYGQLTAQDLYHLYLAFQPLFLAAVNIETLPVYTGKAEIFWMKGREQAHKAWWYEWLNSQSVSSHDLDVGHFAVVKDRTVLERV
ncbi:non-ribosomal peptide synthetase [Pseudoalteromonas sp. JC3]|uniref:non-ribosomal peptide synthetase n=1 Tax=Pseudoalteromonas sp. JC3 TaxID=2810196 RepID=UPI0019D26DF9|nr:non-ribosomal peptide synthetase [Pseudoalteromonas sp. JC3]MBR8842255.1 amino acid adenylation domain-containing protein [Pseudoalteromonas sp. JC3]WJE09620.1 non-ribosomal peptide synthetase [Pseudoalteromonas sp. JC3]